MQLYMCNLYVHHIHMELLIALNWLYSQQCKCIGMHADCRVEIQSNAIFCSPLDTRNVLSIA